MKTSSFTLLSATTFGSSMGNYDGVSLSFSGDPLKAAAYYTKAKDLQTISWYFTGFVGVLTIEATLDELSSTNNYFTIHTVGDGVTPLSENNFANLSGKYTWIRISVSAFTAGVIEKVSMGY